MTPEKLMGHRWGWSGRFASGLVGGEGITAFQQSDNGWLVGYDQP